MLRPGLATSARIPVMGCAPPTLPTAGKEARLGWTAMEKQAGRAPSSALPGAVPIRARLHVPGGDTAHHRGAPSCPQLSPGHSQLFASPVLISLTPPECPNRGAEPPGRSRRGCPGRARCRSAAVQGPLPAIGFPLGAAPSHSPTLTSCGAGGGPRAGLGRETLGDTCREPERPLRDAVMAECPFPQCAAATWPSRVSSSRTRSTSAPRTTSSSTGPAVTAAGTSSPARSSLPWAGPTTPSALSAAPAGEWEVGEPFGGCLELPVWGEMSSDPLPTSPWLQEAVPHRRQGHLQREGLCLPKLLPHPAQHQAHQDPRAQP